jgi:hypothetical protein
LIVFERQATANPSVYVGIDMASAQRADRETRDAMVRLYGSLCQQFQSHHWSLWVSMGDRGLVRLSPAQRVAFLDHLATWDFSGRSQFDLQGGSRSGVDGLVNDRQYDLGIGVQRPGAQRAVADRTLWVTCGTTAGTRGIQGDVLQGMGGAMSMSIFRVVSGFTSSIHSSSVEVQDGLVSQEQAIAGSGVSLRAGCTYSVTCMVEGTEGEQGVDRVQWDEQLQRVWRSYCTGTFGLEGSIRSTMEFGVLEGVS